MSFVDSQFSLSQGLDLDLDFDFSLCHNYGCCGYRG